MVISFKPEPHYIAVQGKPLQPGGPTWFVVYNEGTHKGLRQSLLAYETEAKAKRRCRDLEARNSFARRMPKLIGPD